MSLIFSGSEFLVARPWSSCISCHCRIIIKYMKKFPTNSAKCGQTLFPGDKVKSPLFHILTSRVELGGRIWSDFFCLLDLSRFYKLNKGIT
jgi:hypothetical protein